jgi:hypothetical protein
VTELKIGYARVTAVDQDLIEHRPELFRAGVRTAPASPTMHRP